MERMSLAASRALIAFGLALALLCLPRAAQACVGAVEVCGDAEESSLGLIVGGRALPVVVAAGIDPAVRDAAENFAGDLGRVGGTLPSIVEQVPGDARAAVIVGIAGQGGLIDQLATAGKIDLSQVAGRWEAFGQFVV